jgi:hypothetical protein
MDFTTAHQFSLDKFEGFHYLQTVCLQLLSHIRDKSWDNPAPCKLLHPADLVKLIYFWEHFPNGSSLSDVQYKCFGRF